MTGFNSNGDWPHGCYGGLKVILCPRLYIHAALLCGSNVGRVELAFVILKSITNLFPHSRVRFTYSINVSVWGVMAMLNFFLVA